MTTVSDTKVCPVCRVEKAFSDFPPRSADRRGEPGSRCHACDADRSRTYYAANREKKAAYYQTQNRGRVLGRYADRRARAIEVYGGRCVRCGAPEGLEFDHVDDDGGAHREVESHKAMYRRIAELGRPIEDYRLQLLCRPCHQTRQVSEAEVEGWEFPDRSADGDPLWLALGADWLAVDGAAPGVRVYVRLSSARTAITGICATTRDGQPVTSAVLSRISPPRLVFALSRSTTKAG